MFNWKIKATNAIYLEDSNGQQGRPFKSRFLQAGLVKYDFGVCLLQKETIDRFINTFMGVPVIIDHKDNITESDKVGSIDRIWFSPEDGWFWCSGVITDDTAVKLIEQGYNVSCQYSITEYADNVDDKLHNGNPYDKEILNGVFEHLAIVENPRYEGAYIAVNAYIASNAISRNNIVDVNGNEHSETNGQYVKKGNNAAAQYKNYADFENAYNDLIVDSPKDYPLTDYNEILKDLGITDKKPKEVKSPIETIQVRARNIKHLTNSSDKSRIKSLNKMFATLEDPLLINELGDKKVYFKLFKDNNNTKRHLTVVGQDDDGNFLTTTIPVKRDNWYLEQLKKGTTIYDSLSKRRKSDDKTAPVNNIIADSKSDFNPNATNSIEGVNEASSSNNQSTPPSEKADYNTVFDYLTNSKGEQMDNKKDVITAMIDALKARNEADEKKEDEKKEETASNESVDKRDLIRQIMAIAGKHEDNEDVRTIAKLAEKLAYDKSEAGTADNESDDEKDEKKEEKKDKKDDEEAKNKCKNEGDDTNYEELYKELKAKVDEEAANKKAKNSMDELVNQLYKAVEPDFEPAYISPKQGIELGKKIYG